MQEGTSGLTKMTENRYTDLANTEGRKINDR